MSEQLRILCPCGILGYGFPEDSFLRGMEKKPDAIVVDAGSTDAGPHKLGKGVSIVSRLAMKKDVSYLVNYGTKQGIPIIIGSAGGAGAKVHVEWTLDILNETLEENGISAKVAVIWADIDKTDIYQALEQGCITPMSATVPEMTQTTLDSTHSVVAQMGHEPILKALESDVDIIICGRAYDPSPFAALGIKYGFDSGLCYHMGKVLECGALCAELGSAKDCIVGTLYNDHFVVEATNPKCRCTVTSVAAHTFYEKDNPYILHGPGFHLDLSACQYVQKSETEVRVTGSKFIVDEQYRIKLEGARQVAYRTFFIGGVRDPLLLSILENVQENVMESVRQQFNYIDPERYSMRYYNYGMNAVMGENEPQKFAGHEVGVLFEAIADTQELADAICAALRSTMLHYGYEGRKTTAGNLAFPYAPNDITFGPVYQFSVFHLMDVDDGIAHFPIQIFTYPQGEME